LTAWVKDVWAYVTGDPKGRSHKKKKEKEEKE